MRVIVVDHQHLLDARLFILGKRFRQKGVVEPLAQRAFAPCHVYKRLVIGARVDQVPRDEHRAALLGLEHDPLQRLLAVGQVIVLLIAAKDHRIARGPFPRALFRHGGARYTQTQRQHSRKNPLHFVSPSFFACYGE